MTAPLDILRAPAPRARLDASGNAAAEFSDKYAREDSAGDIAQAVAAFNAEHPVHELLASAGVELHEQGREWRTVNGCPLPGCTSTHDAFRVHIDRKAGDTRGPQWACRKCERGGDALRLAMLLAGADPNERGATARFLRERGLLSARTPHFAQDRPGRAKATQHTVPRKKTPSGATNEQPVPKGQVARVPPPLSGEGQPVLATGEGAGSAPVRGRGELCPTPTGSQGARVPAGKPGGMVGSVPADPLRWSRPDVLAAFGRHPTPDEIEALDERAGIMEFDAGLARAAAERGALQP